MKSLRHLILPTILTGFAILLTILLPSVEDGVENGSIIGLFVSIYVLFIFISFIFYKHPIYKQVTSDIISIIFVLLILWELSTNRFEILTSFIYPTPGEVMQQFKKDAPDLVLHLLASIRLLASGFLLAVCLAIPLGIISAWFGRLDRIMRPIASVLAPIPPIVLIPYAIAILPSFRASSIFVIFIGAFWPIFVAALNGVAGIDRRYIDSARTLGLNNWTLFRKIIFPAALPSIFTGLTIGMILSFILLTAAEMIGANAGIGYYVKLATDFGNYTRVVAGILFIGLIVTIVMTILTQLERYLLRWRK
ncbi:ABC transporter permease [Aquibacillus rhizosphaerae]|uniref:ABC transporter permease n=1 Tax=Aquibacillus rhizosphaerae TaxID=3051431 RepID=A0ABT7L1Z8_9BACI|nr:ABC transporter permease [Aquibacillus sp. LR5S19]MDL4839180.1 ABC transporter permease [Aquibacillus sp. LR5S19]